MNTIFLGDAIEQMRKNIPDAYVQCCVTSPPYWGLRDYGQPGQIGLEKTPAEFVSKMVNVFAEVWRVMKSDGVVWVNLGDCWNAYNGGAGPSSSISRGAQTKERPRLDTGFGLRSKQLKPKDLIGIPWRVAFALQEHGWYLRQCVIWHKPNPMPESVKDRCTNAHEYVFLLSKSDRYYWNSEAIQEDGVIEAGTRAAKGSNVRSELKDVNGRPPEYWEYTGKRNKRSVWTVNTRPFKGAHFATFPMELIEPMILAGSRPGDIILDPFMGAGTTACATKKHRRQYVGCEINPEYVAIATRRIANEQPLLIADLL